MANLVTVTKEGRVLLKVGGLLLGVFILIYLVFKGGTIVQGIFFPKPPPPPLEALGKLPKIQFPQSTSSVIPTYNINTVNGQLPVLADRVNVYKLKTPEPNLLALQTAKNSLDSSEFVLNQVKKTSTLYQWTHSKTGATIDYDIVTKNFTISSGFLTNPSLSSQGLMPGEDQIKRDTFSFLDRMGATTDNFDQDKTKVEYLEVRNGLLVAAQNLGSARYARITLVQKLVDEIPIINDSPTESITSFVVSYPQQNFAVLEGTFYNFEIDMEAKSDYAIKTAAQALEDLKAGNAYVLNPGNLQNVDITDVQIRYFLNKQSGKFLLPVIVFSGVNNFTAYVDAIPDSTSQDLPPSE